MQGDGGQRLHANVGAPGLVHAMAETKCGNADGDGATMEVSGRRTCANCDNVWGGGRGGSVRVAQQAV